MHARYTHTLRFQLRGSANKNDHQSGDVEIVRLLSLSSRLLFRLQVLDIVSELSIPGTGYILSNFRYIVCLLVSFVPYPISEFFSFLFVYQGTSFFFFRSSYFSGGVFFLLCSRTRYASAWFAYLDSLAFGFSLSHCDHRTCTSPGWRIRKGSGGTADVG